MTSILAGIADKHGRDRKQPKQGESVHSADHRNGCLQSSEDTLVFFLGGFLTSRFGAFLFAMPKVYAIGQAVQ